MKNRVLSLVFLFGTAVLSARPFTIVDSVHLYNLDPHTANYASEAQMLGQDPPDKVACRGPLPPTATRLGESCLYIHVRRFMKVE